MSVYGIDLGTTYSCIAQCDGQQVSTFHPSGAHMGGTVLPSVVFFDEQTGKPIVGDTAKSGLKSPRHAPQTLSLFKRYMGKETCSRNIRYQGRERSVSPVEGSACILHTLLQSANETQRANHLPEVRKAVITIPAGFTSEQRDCTKAAAEMAGIEVLGLIHEPTAAAISYNIAAGETILVFDLGGGTLDVSIVHNQAGTYSTLASASDMDVLKRYVGGQDWDEALIDFAVTELGLKRDKNNHTHEGHLHLEAEQCKMQLSERTTAPFTFGLDSVDIKRSDFERITKNLVNDCMKVVEHAMSQCKNKVDRCVLAGGSSNMPMIRSAISRALGGRIGRGQTAEWFPLGDPEQAIAKGAARYAFMLERGTASKETLVIKEKSSHAYGTLIGTSANPRICNLILPTDPMIFRGSHRFNPGNDHQASIRVDIFENNSTEAEIGYKASDHKKIYDQVYKFDKPEQVTKSTTVTFTVSRDKDGIISITVSSDGNHTDQHRISTVIPPVTAEVRQQILQSIKLMDQAV